MNIRKFKPTSPGQRFQTVSTFEEITRDKPHRPLVKGRSKSGGRNNHGRMTLRRRGGGHKRRYRQIDFRRDKHGVPGRIESIEYDPNRTARIALVLYADGERRYILAPLDLRVGSRIQAGSGSDIQPGNALPLAEIPLGTVVHNIELRPGKGGQLVRSGGANAQLLAKEGNYAQLRLPSGEVRMIHLRCMASIGQLSNEKGELVSLGKAGRSRWMGRRPKVRGVAMNPIDHPMGGGEGKTAGGRHPVSPWGKPTKGARTRSKKQSDRYIVRRRGWSRRRK